MVDGFKTLQNLFRLTNKGNEETVVIFLKSMVQRKGLTISYRKA